MDIFKWADDFSWLADYYDNKTGNIYKIIEAKENKSKIRVVDYTGHTIKYIYREEK